MGNGCVHGAKKATGAHHTDIKLKGIKNHKRTSRIFWTTASFSARVVAFDMSSRPNTCVDGRVLGGRGRRVTQMRCQSE